MKKEFVIALTASGVILTSVSGAHLLQASQEKNSDILHVNPVGEISNSRLRTSRSSGAIFAKEGNQKVLTVLVNLSDSPFTKDEKYYSDMLYGSGVDSLKSYLESQSNGKMTISPATTTGTTYPGIIKVDINSADVSELAYNNYEGQLNLSHQILDQVKGQIDLSSADENGDKQFNDSWFVDSADDNDELFINMIFSGSVDKDGGSNDKLQAWPHVAHFNTTLGEYTLNNSGLITSEKHQGTVIGLSTFAHEFMHNLNGRDMYADTTSIGLWSIMSKSYGNRDGTDTAFHANPLDPLHKIRMGWTTPVKVDLTKASSTIDIDKTKTYYIEHPTNKDIVYLLDYRDFDDIYEKANYRYGLRGDGLVVWQLNKNSLKADWNDDWQFNTGGIRSSVFVLPKNTGEGATVENTLTPVGSTLTIDGLADVSIKVNNHQLVVKTNATTPEITYSINAIDRKFKQGTNITDDMLLEGVTVKGSDGSDVTAQSNLTVTNTIRPNESGDFTATYNATYNGKALTKTIKVTVEANNNIMAPPVIHAQDKQIVAGSNWNPKEGVTAENGNGEDITKDLVVYEDTVKPDTPGRYIVVYGVTDSLGQETVLDIVVTVVENDGSGSTTPDKDTTAPVITGADTKVIKVGEIFKPLEGVSAKDNVDDVVEVRVKYTNVNNKEPGTYKVIYEATDKAGNKATVERTVQVIGDTDTTPTKDTVPPVLKASSDKIKIPVGAEFDEKSIVTATDNVDGEINHAIQITKSNLNKEKPGVYSITYEVKDKAGNKSTLTVQVEVYKSEVQFVIPDVRVHKGSKFDPKAGIKVIDATGKDVTDKVVVSGDVDTSDIGTHKVKYTYTDSQGNKVSHIRNVEVVAEDANIVPPTVDIEYRVIKVGTKFDIADGITAKSHDGTDLTKSIKLKSGEIDSNSVGLYPLVYSVEDADGNVTEIDRVMLVLPMDIEAGSPHIFLKTNKIEKGSKFDPKSIAVAVDKEDGLLGDIVVKTNNVDTSKVGIYTVSYSVIDSDGNVANQSFEVEVVEKVSMDDSNDKVDSNDDKEEPVKDDNKPLEGGELNVGTEGGKYQIPTTGTIASSGLFAGVLSTLSGLVLAFRNKRK